MDFFDKKRAINLDISPQCSLKCSACFRQTPEFLKLRARIRDTSLSEFEKIVQYFNEIEFCGNMGDPIFHPHFHDFLKLSGAKHLKVRVATAASHQSKNWYEVAFKMNPRAQWVFGIDGLPENSHRYREKQDGKKLFQMMLMGRKMGVPVLWQYLIFNYNYQEMESAKALAAKHQITIEFFNTSRGPSSLLLGQAQDKNRNTDASDGINFRELDPKCFNGKKLGHSPLGYLVPCCWHGDQDVERTLPLLCNERTHLSSVKMIEDIFKEPGWEAFEKSLRNSKLGQIPSDKCAQKCTTGKENLKRLSC